MCRSILIHSFSVLLVLMLLLEHLKPCRRDFDYEYKRKHEQEEYTPHLPVVAVCGKFPLSALGWWNWQTRTFEGRMPKGLRVQVPPRAQFSAILSVRRLIVQNRWLVRNKSNQSEIARISGTYIR